MPTSSQIRPNRSLILLSVSSFTSLVNIFPIFVNSNRFTLVVVSLSATNMFTNCPCNFTLTHTHARTHTHSVHRINAAFDTWAAHTKSSPNYSAKSKSIEFLQLYICSREAVLRSPIETTHWEKKGANKRNRSTKKMAPIICYVRFILRSITLSLSFSLTEHNSHHTHNTAKSVVLSTKIKSNTTSPP